MPKVGGTDNGIWRRIKRIPFLVQISAEERDNDLGNKLRGEADGILAWAIEGLKRYYREGLNEPSAVVEATEEYKADMDVFGMFLADCVVKDKDTVVKASVLYARYKAWASAEGLDYPLSQIEFGKRMKKREYQSVRIGRQRTRYWKGLGLTDDTNPTDEQANEGTDDLNTDIGEIADDWSR